MNYEYLWQNLRVIGGAYGCMSNFGRSGTGCLVSYRDPKLAATDKIYEGIPEYLKNFSIDERDMTKYVIGAMSSVDTPLSPAVKGTEKERTDPGCDPGGYPRIGRYPGVHLKNRCFLCHWK